MTEYEYPGAQAGLISSGPIKAPYIVEPTREPLLLADGRLNPAEECQRADEALRPLMTTQGHLAALEVLLSEARSNEEAYDHKERPELAGRWQSHCLRLGACHGELTALWSAGAVAGPGESWAEARPDLAHRDGPDGDPSPSDELAEILPFLEAMKHIEALRAVLGVCKDTARRLQREFAAGGEQWKYREANLLARCLEEALAEEEGC